MPPIGHAGEDIVGQVGEKSNCAILPGEDSVRGKETDKKDRCYQRYSLLDSGLAFEPQGHDTGKDAKQ